MYAPSQGVFLLPVRQRPHRLAGVLARKSHAPVLVMLDSVDPWLPQHIETCETFNADFVVLPGEMTVTEKINQGVIQRPDKAYYGFLADDLILPGNHHWPGFLTMACPEWGLSYCADGIHNQNIPTHPVICGKLVRALGWMAYPPAGHNGVDCMWQSIANEFGGCQYVTEISFTHRHVCNSTAIRDDNHNRVNRLAERDDAAWNQFYQGGGMQEACARVKLVRDGG